MKRRQWGELMFRWHRGYWCEHTKIQGVDIEELPGGGWTHVQKRYNTWRNLQRRTDGSGWEMIDTGMRQMRQCYQCGFTEFR